MSVSIKEKDEASKPSRKFQFAVRDHLIELPNDDWALWQLTCLRGAGFPAHMIQDLAAPECASAADGLLLLESESREKQAEAVAALRHDLDHCPDGVDKKELVRAIRQLQKSKPTPPLDLPGEAARQRFWPVHSLKTAAEKNFREKFAAALPRLSEKIKDIARNPRFREAVLLQNRSALRMGVDLLLRDEQSPEKRGSNERHQEKLVANYLQRYCVKNDSIGFFGPFGWAKFNPERESIVAHAGPGLVSQANAYFEQWCIEALVEKVEEDPTLREWLPPRCLPAFYLEGNKLHLPGGDSTVLPALHASVLKRCTGEQTASEIATQLMATPGSGVTRDKVYELLQEFRRRGIIVWKFEVPRDPYPERRARKLFEGIGVEAKRQASLAMLDKLEHARDQVRSAFGNVSQLDAAMEKLETTFRRLTGKDASRNAGETYASRTLVYQDCRRDMEVEVGAEIIDALSAPLTLLLTTARWFTYEMAAVLREKCRQIHAEALRKSRKPYVELIEFWSQIQPILLDPEKRLFSPVSDEFQSRWGKILRLPGGQRQVTYTSQELEGLVEKFFAAPHAGWETARYNSPDVMIAAASVEAIQKGEYFLVLGELHMAMNTLRGNAVIFQHPCPEQMFQAIERDMPVPQVVPMAPRSWPRLTTRTTMGLISGQSYYLEASEDSLSSGPRSRTLPIAAFVVQESPEGLVVRTRDGQLSFDVIEFLGEVLSGQAADHMKIMPAARRIPRVTIDKLVIQREQWSFSAAEMHFAQEADESGRFLAARRWMHQHQLPRLAFVRVHLEVKPFYVDFESPVYVEILAKMVRRVLASDKPGTPVVVSEMLPTIDQLWLPDAANQKYTSELRIVVVDQVRKATVAQRKSRP